VLGPIITDSLNARLAFASFRVRFQSANLEPSVGFQITGPDEHVLADRVATGE